MKLLVALVAASLLGLSSAQAIPLVRLDTAASAVCTTLVIAAVVTKPPPARARTRQRGR